MPHCHIRVEAPPGFNVFDDSGHSWVRTNQTKGQAAVAKCAKAFD